MSSSSWRRLAAVAAVTTLVAPLAACADDGGSPQDALVIYSGRNENLVGPILEQLEETVGVPVEVRYAGSSELAAQLLEEGEGTDADVFFSQDAGALGALAGAGLLAELDEATTSRTLERFRDPAGRWVPTSARARVVAYDPATAPEVAQMTSIDEVLDPAYRGRVGLRADERLVPELRHRAARHQGRGRRARVARGLRGQRPAGVRQQHRDPGRRRLRPGRRSA